MFMDETWAATIRPQPWPMPQAVSVCGWAFRISGVETDSINFIDHHENGPLLRRNNQLRHVYD